MIADTALPDLPQKLLHDNGEQFTRRMAARAPQPDWCRACYGDGPLRPWPLADEWGDAGTLVCEACWLGRVRGEVVETWTLGGCWVSTTHPVYGVLPRGCLRAVGIRPDDLRPTTVWGVRDQDAAVVVAEFVGDFVDARAALLDATTWADQIDNPSNDKEEG